LNPFDKFRFTRKAISPPANQRGGFRRRELLRLLALSVGSANSHRTDRAPMAHAQGSSFLLGKQIGGKTVLIAVALATLLALPSLAQDAGVSGIPPGPGNANGLNGSIRDPSGIGNAARLPAIPPPTIRPVTPTIAAPLSATRPLVRQGSTRVRTVKLRRQRFSSSRAQHNAERTAIRENDRLLNHGITSICRGC
jgi:hypothetical protein